MTYFKKIFITLTALSAVAAPIWAWAATAKVSFPAGTLIKAEGSPAIYYIATDGKRYAFPDSYTYHSWYSSFKGVRKITAAQLKTIAAGAGEVPLRPGALPVKFAGNEQIYVISGYNVLRAVNTSTLAQLYGGNWSQKTAVFPAARVSKFVVGEKLALKADEFDEEGEDYNVIAEKAKVQTIDDQLLALGITKPPKAVTSKSKGVAANVSTLKSLAENLKGNLSPRFAADKTFYGLTALYAEDVLKIKPTATNGAATIKINGLLTASGAEFSLALLEGGNEIKIEVISPDRSSVSNYTLYVTREAPARNVRLKALKENLRDDLTPAFDPETRNYRLKAKYYENEIELTATLEDTKAQLYVAGEKMDSGKVKKVALSYGENSLRLDVMPQKGETRTYTITVDRSRYPDSSDAELKNIRTSIKADMEPRAFDPNHANYYILAPSKYKKVSVYADPKNTDATVLINGKPATNVLATLVTGTNVFEIEVISPDGYKKEYRLEIDRQ